MFRFRAKRTKRQDSEQAASRIMAATSARILRRGGSVQCSTFFFCIFAFPEHGHLRTLDFFNSTETTTTTIIIPPEWLTQQHQITFERCEKRAHDDVSMASVVAVHRRMCNFLCLHTAKQHKKLTPIGPKAAEHPRRRYSVMFLLCVFCLFDKRSCIMIQRV